MAYSLSDYFRPLRILFRVNGLVNGIGIGLCLLLIPRVLLTLLGSPPETVLWPLRLAGAQSVVIGILLLNQAAERTINPSISMIAIISNALAALVLLLGYLQQEFTDLQLVGQIGLTAVFVLYLLGAVVPIRYMRADYRRM